jgi:hypothetical protein
MLVLAVSVFRTVLLMTEKGKAGLAITELFSEITRRCCPELLSEWHREFLVNWDAALQRKAQVTRDSRPPVNGFPLLSDDPRRANHATGGPVVGHLVGNPLCPVNFHVGR